MAVDLHLHSTVSDGTLTPREVVEASLARGLKAMALTDHDTVGGLAEARAASDGRIIFIPGLEISTCYGYQEVHVLGYFIDEAYAPLLETMAAVQEARLHRAQEMVDRLRELGLDIEYKHVAQLSPDGSVGRPHVASALTQAGIVQSPAEAFDKYLKRGQPAYVERYRLSVEETISLIREAKGLPVLAHPKLIRRDSIIPELIRRGIAGLEVYHTHHTPADVQRYAAMARGYGLIATGGSDSHGPEGPDPVEIGGVFVPDQCAESVLAWKARRERRLS